MYKLTTLLCLLLSILVTQAAPKANSNPTSPKAKYIFVLFADGMGDNLSRLTELYLSEKYKKDTLINYSKFPHVALTTTHSLSSQLTCSSAAGTAIICGKKTILNSIGMTKDQEALESIGTKLKKEGYRLGVCTNNGIDHATPACVYAQTTSRKDFFLIASQLAKSDIDFAAGAGFIEMDKSSSKWTPKSQTIQDSLQKYGWQVTTDKTEAKNSKAKKLLLLNTLNGNAEDLPFSIDRSPEDLNLKDFAKIGIDRLYTPNGKGFFFLLEAGSIDHAMHSSDAASAVHEVINFIETIDIALDFYHKHPDETLLLVVSDHETGGLTLGKSGAKKITTAPLLKQKMSSHKMEELIQKGDSHPDTIIQFIDRNGFKLTEKDIQFIKKIAKQVIPETQKALYSRNNTFVSAAMQIMHERCHISFSTRSHSGARIPIFALGAGAEHFHGVIENSDIPALIYKAMGKTWENTIKK